MLVGELDTGPEGRIPTSLCVSPAPGRVRHMVDPVAVKLMPDPGSEWLSFWNKSILESQGWLIGRGCLLALSSLLSYLPSLLFAQPASPRPALGLKGARSAGCALNASALSWAAQAPPF